MIDEIMSNQRRIITRIEENKRQLLGRLENDPDGDCFACQSFSSWRDETVKKIEQGVPHLIVSLGQNFSGPFELSGDHTKIIGETKSINARNVQSISFELKIVVFPENEFDFSILKIDEWFDLQVNRITKDFYDETEYSSEFSFTVALKHKVGNACSIKPLTCCSNVWQQDSLEHKKSVN